MTWTIRSIVLPIHPKSFSKKTTRVQQPVAVVGDFPDPGLNQPTKFSLNIKGFIWPRSLAQQLDEATKNADTENLAIHVTDDVANDPWLSGLYSVTNSTVERKKPLFQKIDGVIEQVYEYNMTFAKFADAGADQAADEAGPEEDEIGTGFLDMDEIGFDSDGDGDIDLNGLYNFLTNIFTFGASG